MTLWIGEIEAAIVKRLQEKLAKDKSGYTVQKIDTYGGELTEEIERAIASFPAILVVYTGASVVSATTQSAKVRHAFNIIICAQSLRNEKTSRHSAAGKVGSYQMISDTLAVLIGQKLKVENPNTDPVGIPMTPLTFRAVRPLMNDRADGQLASIYSIDLDTDVTASMQPSDNLADFITFHANWDIPPLGNVQPPLPADDTADATDHVTLEQ